jgi:gliding motility-associated-like protein
MINDVYKSSPFATIRQQVSSFFPYFYPSSPFVSLRNPIFCVMTKHEFYTRWSPFEPLIGLRIPLCTAIALLCFVQTLRGQIQNFPCDNNFYLVTFSTAGSVLQKINFDPNTGKEISEQIPLSEPKRRISCLGYSVRDGFLYALDFDSRELLRINNKGEISNLGVPANLDKNLLYFAGEVNALGRSLTVIGRDPVTQEDKLVYSINLLQAPYYAGSVRILSESPVQINDVATHPTLGVLYGFDIRNRKLLFLGNGAVSSYAYPNIPQTISALTFDKRGNLYGYGNPSGGETYDTWFRIDRSTGKATSLDKGLSGREADACSCAYSHLFTKEITPQEVLPCSEITIEYQLWNSTGTSWLGLHFIDSLPKGFTIQKIEKKSSTLGTVESAVGSNKIEISNFDWLLDENVIRLKVFVDDVPPGLYKSQAVFSGLPKMLGTRHVSDDKLTIAPFDSSKVEVKSAKTLKLQSQLKFSCQGDSAFVEAPLQADTYEWSNGATTRTLRVKQPGVYTLRAKTPCLNYADTVIVGAAPPLLSTSIKAPKALETGEKGQVEAEIPTKGKYTYLWQSSGGLQLACNTCAKPDFTALRSGSITLLLRDEQGCSASASAEVEVNQLQNVYAPAAFSPNGDGQNERFFLQGREGSQLAFFRVHDRWGNLLYEQKDLPLNQAETGWDGSSRGHPLPPGQYTFESKIIFADGKEKVLLGEFMLIR